MVTKEQFIAELNGDLALEYAAAIQYYQHAAIITGPFWVTIEELQAHAKEEIDHAVLLSDRISYLGGVPVMRVGERKTSKQADEMLKQDLAGERTAITRYIERVNQAKQLGDAVSVKMLRGILADEQHHENDLMNFLGLEESVVSQMLDAVVPEQTAPGEDVELEEEATTEDK